MRFRKVHCIVLALVCTSTSLGQANRDHQPGIRDGIMSLFRIAKVQAELELSREQAELLFALQADLFTEYRSARRDRRNQDGLPTALEVSRTSQQVANRLLRTILERPQYDRLQELWLQRRGLRAIISDSLVKSLELTDEQRMETRELVDQLSEQYMNGRLSISDKEIARKIAGALTKEQQDQWESMLGKRFSF